MSPSQMRGARAMLGWTVKDAATRAGLTANTISRLENGGDAKASTLAALRSAYEAAGVVFIPENGGGSGVRFGGRTGSEGDA